MDGENWDDLRYVLAVAEAGSVSGAARHLQVNHATVLRRIGAFEARAGVSLFDKTPRGYDVPVDRMSVIRAAREAEAAMLGVERAIRGVQAPLSGEVRLTSTDTFCQVVLPPVLAGIRASAPDLTIALLCSNAHLDFARTEADVTVRPAVTLPDDLVGEQAALLRFSVYGASGGGAGGWLDLSGPLSRSAAGRWLHAEVAPADITGAADSFLVLRELAASGQGMAILPDILGRHDARLVRLAARSPEIAVPIWVASHSDLAGLPRLAQLRGLLVAALADRFDGLQGNG